VRRELPAKLYYRIGEVASLVGVEPHVLRYWETEFRSVRPQKSAKGQRIYSRRDVETLLKVRDLLYAHKFTIAGAKRKLREGGIEPPPAEPAVSSEEALRLREALVSLRGELRAALDELDPAAPAQDGAAASPPPPLPKPRLGAPDRR
jgi:DNA-binding transcriptional MerR regulator